MRKKVGLILIVIAVIGLVLSLAVKMVEPECCSLYDGVKIGSGIVFLNHYKIGTIINCMCAADTPLSKHYRIIPGDFIGLSLLLGAYGAYFIRSRIKAVDKS
jgi:hypothetical protein